MEFDIVTAFVAALIYAVGCWVFGERFPFSRFRLYSSAGNREFSAVAVFLEGDKPVKIWDYHRFSGFDTRTFLPDHMPTGLQWISYEYARWVDEHQDEDGPGSLEVSFGYRLFYFDENGQLVERIEVHQRGRAWPI